MAVERGEAYTLNGNPMDTHLNLLIQDYARAVNSAVALMQKGGLPKPSSNIEWSRYEIPQKGVLPGGVPYFKHGFGCFVELPGSPVDFDFGFEGQTNGFDSGRLLRFAGDRLHSYGFSSVADFESIFKQAVDSGSLRFSGYVLYYPEPSNGA
ncbi:DUF6896 domain-containing protein [Geothrix edaphica]|uniref:DUF6896 domain-containing protein n=1 Tax=Geothrix edaphica TaxID=2927976 RepID=UPI0025550952|nr:hypothetical protein [Geothrix edaphica]